MSTSTATIVSAPCTNAPAAAANVMLPIKWDHFGQIRRFSIPITAGGDVYVALMEKIHPLRPEFQGDLAWKDEEDDLIVISSAEELKEAMALTKDGQMLKVFSAENAEDVENTVVIDDEEEEESGDEPVVQFMPRRLRREHRHSRGHHEHSRSRSAHSDRSRSYSRSRSASRNYSSDESNGCRKMKRRMAKSCNKGHKKEAKMMMKMMRPYHSAPLFAIRCSGMAKNLAHHQFHPKMVKGCGFRHGPHKRMRMMRMMAEPGPYPFFEGRRGPWMPHDHRRPPPPMLPNEFHSPPPPSHPCIRLRRHSMPPVDHSAGFPMDGPLPSGPCMRRRLHMPIPPPPHFQMDRCQMMGGFGMKNRRGMGHCEMAMGQRGIGHGRMGFRGMGMDRPHQAHHQCC